MPITLIFPLSLCFHWASFSYAACCCLRRARLRLRAICRYGLMPTLCRWCLLAAAMRCCAVYYAFFIHADFCWYLLACSLSYICFLPLYDTILPCFTTIDAIAFMLPVFPHVLRRDAICHDAILPCFYMLILYFLFIVWYCLWVRLLRCAIYALFVAACSADAQHKFRYARLCVTQSAICLFLLMPCWLLQTRYLSMRGSAAYARMQRAYWAYAYARPATYYWYFRCSCHAFSLTARHALLVSFLLPDILLLCRVRHDIFFFFHDIISRCCLRWYCLRPYFVSLHSDDTPFAFVFSLLDVHCLHLHFTCYAYAVRDVFFSCHYTSYSFRHCLIMLLDATLCLCRCWSAAPDVSLIFFGALRRATILSVIVLLFHWYMIADAWCHIVAILPAAVICSRLICHLFLLLSRWLLIAR